jgi:hypothetical protein
MNRTVEKLKATYVARFMGTAVCVAGSIGASHLILLGKTSDNVLAAGIAIVGGCIAWTGTVDLSRRWKQLKQLSILQEHGPYGTSEDVPPIEVAPQVGDDGSNIWG